jgi:gamma-glutamyltranspeptidase/glutathione hydrolase
MAATSHPLATQVALDVLKAGGNAIDAAIAANACLGLMEPTGCGIGGDLFAMVWSSEDEKLYGLNASGRSPMSLTATYFRDRDYEFIPSYGPLTVSVPGCVDGWFELHERFGVLDMSVILAPAIRYAREGFPLTELIAHYLKRNVRNLSEYEGITETFLANGNILEKGAIFKNPFLGNTLEKIAKQGRDLFYKGEMARAIASYMQEQGGFLKYEDMAAHQSEWIDPVSTNYRGADVWELPPNGQGIAVLQMLNILEAFDIAALGFGSAEYIHLLTEAKKLAYEDRAKFYADPAFNHIPVEHLISKEYAVKRRALIQPGRASDTFPAGDITDGETIYLATADADGNMVSLIQSNYRGMGSGMTPEGLGFVLQNRGSLFTLEEGHLNEYAAGKRPFHTIIPAFVTRDGKPLMAFGVMGGAMQPQGHVQILVNMLDFGMGLQEAGDAPRINHTGSSQPTGTVMQQGGIIQMESGFDDEVIRALRGMGHTVQFSVGVYGGYQAIFWDEEHKIYIGASESRKDGHAAGY